MTLVEQAQQHDKVLSFKPGGFERPNRCAHSKSEAMSRGAMELWTVAHKEKQLQTCAWSSSRSDSLGLRTRARSVSGVPPGKPSGSDSSSSAAGLQVGLPASESRHPFRAMLPCITVVYDIKTKQPVTDTLQKAQAKDPMMVLNSKNHCKSGGNQMRVLPQSWHSGALRLMSKFQHGATLSEWQLLASRAGATGPQSPESTPAASEQL